MVNKLFVALLCFIFSAVSGFAEIVDTPLGQVEITKQLDGLDEPWSLGFLPDGSYLVTERGGSLIHVGKAGARRVSGLPAIEVDGQGGLLDVLIDGDFTNNQWIFLSYNKRGIGTSIFRAVFDVGEAALREGEDIFTMNSPSTGGVHFGGRMVEDGADWLYLTIGERGDRDLAQDLSTDNGTVQHIEKNGNSREIWSYGHRNPQGAARGVDGELYITEHGAMGGDELNLIEKGTNYGWPIISYGLNYNGSKIGEGTAKAGMAQPLHYWDPSIAPSGLVIHSGKNWGQAKGVFFVGSLKFDRIDLLSPMPRPAAIGVIENRATGRVRDLREAPDGSIWFLSVNDGALFRIVPLK